MDWQSGGALRLARPVKRSASVGKRPRGSASVLEWLERALARLLKMGALAKRFGTRGIGKGERFV